MVYKYNGFFHGSLYTLHPNPSASGTINVYCAVEGNEVKTQLDITSSREGTSVGNSAPASWSLGVLSYRGDFQQAVKMVDYSDRCKQWVWAKCYATHINWNGSMYTNNISDEKR